MSFSESILHIAKSISALGHKWEKFESDSSEQGWRRKKTDGSFEYRYQDADPNTSKTHKETPKEPVALTPETE
jgi:hypothetical protein